MTLILKKKKKAAPEALLSAAWPSGDIQERALSSLQQPVPR